MSAAEEVPVRLSVAIIVRDAAEALAETLVSIRNIADEIVVIDTGSGDETKDIAQAFGARLFERRWDDSFSAARNAALTHVRGTWVLWLDAGETLGSDKGRLLKEFVAQHADPGTAYYLCVGLPAVDDLSAREQTERLRLHPRRPGLQYTGRVRENLDRSLFAFGIGVDSLPVAIERSRRDFDPAIKAARAERNLALADLQIAERGPSADMYNCLGEACHALGRNDQAAQNYRQALAAAESGSAAMLEAYYGLLTCLETISAQLPDADGQDPRRTTQLSLCVTALDSFPLDAQLLCALGGYLQSLGRSDLSVKAYDVCYRHGQIEPRLWHLPDIREVAASCQASILEVTGHIDRARELLQDARQAYPDSQRLARQMLEHHVQHGRRDEALLVASQMSADAPARESLRVAIVGACAAVKGNWIAARSYLESAIEAGCRERFAWRWLATSLLALGDGSQVEGVLARWETLDPASPEPAQFRRSLPAAGPSLPKTIDAAGRSLRIDAPQDAAAGPSLTPSTNPAVVSRSVP